jgi:uncharacterized protein
MEFDNSFDVPLPPAAAWPVLMQIEKIVPCMPGAELTEKLDDRNYKGKVSVRLGPVALAFQGTARFEEIDEQNRTARVKASGTDSRGRGGANAVVDFRLEEADRGSKVFVHTNLALSGSVAQYGRGAGMIHGVAAQLLREFATRLKSELDTGTATAPEAATAAGNPTEIPSTAEPARPISGLVLLIRTWWSMFRRLLLGRSHAS